MVPLFASLSLDESRRADVAEFAAFGAFNLCLSFSKSTARLVS